MMENSFDVHWSQSVSLHRTRRRLLTTRHIPDSEFMTPRYFLVISEQQMCAMLALSNPKIRNIGVLGDISTVFLEI